MSRKDCDNSLRAVDATSNARRRTAFDLPALAGNQRRPPHALSQLFITSVAITAAVQTAVADGGSIRVLPSAIVIADSVRVDDVCALRGLNRADSARFGTVVVGEGPPAGGTRIIHMDRVRAALTAEGANFAALALSGATTCVVRRPVGPEVPKRPVAAESAPDKPIRQSSADSVGIAHTLRDAVLDFFHDEFSRYGGRAEIIFDAGADNTLRLSEPDYSFNVRRRDSRMFGLTSIEVDVLANGKRVQTVPLVVQVRMVRESLVARRAINEGATVQPQDVQLVSMSFDRVDNLGLGDPVQAIGQQAKRLIRAGALIESHVLEPVPLVRRGQLVTLISAVGGVRIVTTGKAAADGLLGELVTVRTVDDSRQELDAVVTGMGKVQVGDVRGERFTQHRRVDPGSRTRRKDVLADGRRLP